MRTTTAVLFSVIMLLPAAGMAATITVDSTSTAASLPASCTLRAAIAAVVSAHTVGACPAGDPQPLDQAVVNTVVLPAGAVFTFTDSGSGTPADGAALPEIAIGGPLVIEGRGATIQRSDQLPACVPGGPETPDQFRLIKLFGFAPLASLTLRDLTLRNGCSPRGGGAIFVEPLMGSLVLERVRIIGAKSAVTGAVSFGGVGDFVVRDSHFLQNEATSGPIVRVALRAGRTGRIERSTFSANVATSQILIVSNPGTFEMRDSTVSGNTTTGVGAIGQTAYLSGVGTFKLLHNTFADNQKATGKPQLEFDGNGTVRVQGNWFADTVGPNCGFGGATVVATGVNLSTDTSCNSFAQVTPGQMRPLGNYGGAVPTRPPLTGSAAIDVSSSCADPVTGAPLGTDARGVPRPQDGDQFPGALCDAGAAEFVRNQAPSIALPIAAATLAGQPLLLSSPAIVLTDPDSRELPVELRLEPDDGVVGFDAAQLDCTTGDGNADPVAICRGSIAQLNAALTGLVYTPRAGFTGTDTLRVEVNDLGAGGDDQVPRGDAKDLAIQVLAAAPLIAIAGPIDFGHAVVGTQSQPVAFVIANEGNATLVVQPILLPIGTPFRIEGSCPPLPPAAACPLQAYFSPTSAGAASFQLGVNSNAANSPTSVTLQGIGQVNSDVLLGDGFEPDD